MKIVYAIGLCMLLGNMTACEGAGNKAGSATTANVINTKLAPDEFAAKLTATPGSQLIDVRTPGEYAQGHLKNASNIDINSDDFDTQLGKLDKSKPVMVYCMSGGRSSATAAKLQDLGFTTIYDMKGGIMKWQSVGMPVENGSQAPLAATLDAQTLEKLIATRQYALVDYNARWCEPCKKMLPVLEALEARKPDKLTLVKIDADTNKALLQQKKISGIPYLELYKDGKLVWHHEGYINEQQLLAETGL